MAEEKLDLFQLATSGVAQAGADPPQVMRGELLNFRPTSAHLHHVLNNVLCDAASPDGAVLAYRSEQLAADDGYALSPSVNGGLDPVWNGNRSHAATLADEIHDCPVILAALNSVNFKSYDL